MLNVLQTYLEKNIPFYAYKFPSRNKVYVSTIQQANSFKCEDLSKLSNGDGFVVYPFNDQNEKGWFLEQGGHTEFLVNTTEPIKQDSKFLNNPDYFNNIQFDEYKKQFDKTMHALANDYVNKVVLSKALYIKESLIKKSPEIFKKLISFYPTTFVFFISSPQTGTWIGASPELLFSKEGDKCATVSLAGTRPATDDASRWTDKEIEEQSMVTDFIDDALAYHSVTEFKKMGPILTNVGTLTHLKTTYQFKLPFDSLWGEIVKSLHPTPALCGEPKIEAMKLIQEVELHERGYYGGFLGPVRKNSAQLFVNLRSMKIVNNESVIYVGGGVTKQSNLQNEWNELQLKSKTLLSAL